MYIPASWNQSISKIHFPEEKSSAPGFIASAPGTALSEGPPGATAGIGAGPAFAPGKASVPPGGVATGVKEAGGVAGTVEAAVPLPLAGAGVANGVLLPAAETGELAAGIDTVGGADTDNDAGADGVAGAGDGAAAGETDVAGFAAGRPMRLSNSDNGSTGSAIAGAGDGAIGDRGAMLVTGPVTKEGAVGVGVVAFVTEAPEAGGVEPEETVDALKPGLTSPTSTPVGAADPLPEDGLPATAGGAPKGPVPTVP